MYKILIKNRPAIVDDSEAEKYSYYLEDNKDFETSDLNKAMNKMKELTNTYLVPDMSIIKLISTEISIGSPEVKTIVILPEFIKLVNDGKDFSITFDFSSTSNNDKEPIMKPVTKPEDGELKDYGRCTLCGTIIRDHICNIGSNNTTNCEEQNKEDESKYTDFVAVDVNEIMAQQIKEFLEGRGLTNIIVNETGIKGNNETEKAITGTIDVEKGLFQYYSKNTQLSDYISSAFSIVLKDTTPNIELEAEPEIEPEL